MTAPCVLIVDDNVLNLEMVSYILEQEGYAVHTTDDARCVEQTATALRPDIILMDIQMPHIDGLTLTRILKSKPQTRHAAILAFTAFAMKGDEAKMIAAGCDGYISKPIDVANFAQRLRTFLR